MCSKRKFSFSLDQPFEVVFNCKYVKEFNEGFCNIKIITDGASLDLIDLDAKALCDLWDLLADAQVNIECILRERKKRRDEEKSGKK